MKTAFVDVVLMERYRVGSSYGVGSKKQEVVLQRALQEMTGNTDHNWI